MNEMPTTEGSFGQHESDQEAETEDGGPNMVGRAKAPVRCRAYLVAGRTSRPHRRRLQAPALPHRLQRQSASEQMAKDRETAKCEWRGKDPHRYQVCGEVYGSPSEYLYKQQKEKEQAGGDKPLVAEPIPGPSSFRACPPGHFHGRNGQCLADTPSPCPSGQVLARNGQCVGSFGLAPPCPSGQVLARNGQCVGDFARLRR